MRTSRVGENLFQFEPRCMNQSMALDKSKRWNMGFNNWNVSYEVWTVTRSRRKKRRLRYCVVFVRETKLLRQRERKREGQGITKIRNNLWKLLLSMSLLYCFLLFFCWVVVQFKKERKWFHINLCDVIFLWKNEIK